MDNHEYKCDKCGYEVKEDYNYCIQCGALISSYNTSSNNSFSEQKTSLQREILFPSIKGKYIVAIALIIFISTMCLISFLYNWKPRTILNPEIIEWKKLDLGDSSFESVPWANIVEAKFAVKENGLFFLIKWNNSLPNSIKNDDLYAPTYLIYRKAYISWIIHEGNSDSINCNGVLRVGSGMYIEFLVSTSDFNEAENTIPFMNETTAAFKVIYQKGPIQLDSISQIEIIPAAEYIPFCLFPSDLHSLSELPQSPSNSIKLDGNLTDWSNSEINYIKMDCNNMGSIEELIFPFYESIFVTQTTTGIYGAINLSNNNFTNFITSLGNLHVRINWITDLAAINGSFASDYTFEAKISFNSVIGYSVQNVSINLIAGEDWPLIFESWQLKDDQQGTDTCLEFFFPYTIISNLYNEVDSIDFALSMEIEWR